MSEAKIPARRSLGAGGVEGQRVPNVTLKTRVRDESIGTSTSFDTAQDKLLSASGENPYRWQDLQSADLFSAKGGSASGGKGKKVVLFALPGAFTPTCSSTHLPGYEASYDEFKKLGINEVYCLSVNDAFVMHWWGKHQRAEKVKLIPDGSGDFTRAMGMLVKKDNLGFGERSWRYSMYIEDGVIKKMFVEPGFGDNCPTDPFEVSDAHTMLSYLKMV